MTTFTIPEPHTVLDLTMDDGAILRIRRHGNPDGPRLILCHGNGFATDAYYPFWRHLAARFDLLVYDQRNHGWNPPTDPAAHDVPYFVRDMDRVIDGVAEAFGARITIGAFHSISGITAINHALDIGWRWDALVLFDPPMVPPPGHPLHELARDFELGLSDWSATRPNRFSDPSELTAGFLKSKSLSGWVEGAHDLMARSILRQNEETGDWELACPPECESRVYATNARLHLTPRLGELDGPVKFICSDPETPHARAPGFVNRAMHETFGHAYEAMPGTGHMLQLEAPEACARAVVEFLEGHGVS